MNDQPNLDEPLDENEFQPEINDGEELDELSQEAGELYDLALKDSKALEEKVSTLEAEIAELREQLKRDQAEYVNSRRRIENNAEQSRQNAVAAVFNALLSTLDDLDLARQHGDLADGSPFAAIANKLEDALKAQGLTRFGQVGDEFDPNLHEALTHNSDPDASATTLEVVMQPGYLAKEKVLRPARVGTVGPA